MGLALEYPSSRHELLLLDNAPTFDQDTDGNSFSRGLRSGLYSMAAGQSASDYYEALARDEQAKAKQARADMERLRQQAEGAAPAVQSLKDAHSFTDYTNWAAGMAGQSAPYLVPAVGAGAVGYLAGGPVGAMNGLRAGLGAEIGALTGTGLAMQGMETDQARLGAAGDPEVNRRMTPQQILESTREEGIARTIPQLLIPGAMFTAPVKSIGGAFAKHALVDGGSEAAAELVGQHYATTRNPNRDTSNDNWALLDAGVGGTMLTPFGVAGEMAHRGATQGSEFVGDNMGGVIDSTLARAKQAYAAGREKFNDLRQSFEEDSAGGAVPPTTDMPGGSGGAASASDVPRDTRAPSDAGASEDTEMKQEYYRQAREDAASAGVAAGEVAREIAQTMFTAARKTTDALKSWLDKHGVDSNGSTAADVIRNTPERMGVFDADSMEEHASIVRAAARMMANDAEFMRMAPRRHAEIKALADKLKADPSLFHTDSSALADKVSRALVEFNSMRGEKEVVAAMEAMLRSGQYSSMSTALHDSISGILREAGITDTITLRSKTNEIINQGVGGRAMAEVRALLKAMPGVDAAAVKTRVSRAINDAFAERAPEAQAERARIGDAMRGLADEYTTSPEQAESLTAVLRMYTDALRSPDKVTMKGGIPALKKLVRRVLEERYELPLSAKELMSKAALRASTAVGPEKAGLAGMLMEHARSDAPPANRRVPVAVEVALEDALNRSTTSTAAALREMLAGKSARERRANLRTMLFNLADNMLSGEDVGLRKMNDTALQHIREAESRGDLADAALLRDDMESRRDLERARKNGMSMDEVFGREGAEIVLGLLERLKRAPGEGSGQMRDRSAPHFEGERYDDGSTHDDNNPEYQQDLANSRYEDSTGGVGEEDDWRAARSEQHTGAQHMADDTAPLSFVGATGEGDVTPLASHPNARFDRESGQYGHTLAALEEQYGIGTSSRMERLDPVQWSVRRASQTGKNPDVLLEQSRRALLAADARRADEIRQQLADIEAGKTPDKELRYASDSTPFESVEIIEGRSKKTTRYESSRKLSAVLRQELAMIDWRAERSKEAKNALEFFSSPTQNGKDLRGSFGYIATSSARQGLDVDTATLRGRYAARSSEGALMVHMHEGGDMNVDFPRLVSSFLESQHLQTSPLDTAPIQKLRTAVNDALGTLYANTDVDAAKTFGTSLGASGEKAGSATVREGWLSRVKLPADMVVYKDAAGHTVLYGDLKPLSWGDVKLSQAEAKAAVGKSAGANWGYLTKNPQSIDAAALLRIGAEKLGISAQYIADENISRALAKSILLAGDAALKELGIKASFAFNTANTDAVSRKAGTKTMPTELWRFGKDGEFVVTVEDVMGADKGGKPKVKASSDTDLLHDRVVAAQERLDYYKDKVARLASKGAPEKLAQERRTAASGMRSPSDPTKTLFDHAREYERALRNGVQPSEAATQAWEAMNKLDAGAAHNGELREALKKLEEADDNYDFAFGRPADKEKDKNAGVTDIYEARVAEQTKLGELENSPEIEDKDIPLHDLSEANRGGAQSYQAPHIVRTDEGLAVGNEARLRPPVEDYDSARSASEKTGAIAYENEQNARMEGDRTDLQPALGSSLAEDSLGVSRDQTAAQRVAREARESDVRNALREREERRTADQRAEAAAQRAVEVAAQKPRMVPTEEQLLSDLAARRDAKAAPTEPLAETPEAPPAQAEQPATPPEATPAVLPDNLETMGKIKLRALAAALKAGLTPAERVRLASEALRRDTPQGNEMHNLLLNDLDKDNVPFSSERPASSEAADVERDIAVRRTKHILGEHAAVLFADLGAKTGMFTKAEDGRRFITLSYFTRDMHGAASHESWHAVMDILQETEQGRQVIASVERAAKTPAMQKYLAKAFANEPGVLPELSKPSEAAAYAFQLLSKGAKDMPLGSESIGRLRKVWAAVKSFFGFMDDKVAAGKFMEYVDKGDFLKDIDNPEAWLRNAGQVRTEGFRKSVGDFIQSVGDVGERILSSTYTRAKSLGIEQYDKVSDIMFHPTGGQIYRTDRYIKRYANEVVDAVRGTTAEQQLEALRALRGERGAISPEATALVAKLQNIISGVDEQRTKHGLAVSAGVPDRINYDLVSNHRAEFMTDLRNHGAMADKTDGNLRRIVDDMIKDHEYKGGDALFNTNAAGLAARDKWLDANLQDSMASFIRSNIGQAEAARADIMSRERYGKTVQELLEDGDIDATGSQKATMRDIVDAAHQRLGRDLSPGVRKIMGLVITAENIATLPYGIFSQLMDPLTLAFRKNDFSTVFEDMGRGVKDVLTRAWAKDSKAPKDQWEKLAEFMGSVAQAQITNGLSDMYNPGLHLSGMARKANDLFFRMNGMEQWDRSMRVAATKGAVEFIKTHAEGKNEHSARFLQELGLTKDDVKLGKDGQLDYGNEKIQDAIYQFVTESVVRPDAATNTLWMNDPHFALVAHMRRFTWAFSHFVLGRMQSEAKHGNYMAAMPLLAAIPWMMMTDMVKHAAQFDVRGTQGGVTETLMRGIERAGLMGRSEVFEQALNSQNYGGSFIASLLGPAAEDVNKMARAF